MREQGAGSRELREQNNSRIHNSKFKILTPHTPHPTPHTPFTGH
ncbi:hypothetical protein [Scytonema millei]|nr:hypothetical protein [Scytonema millei]